jgi:predicted transcriptional regulator
MKSISFRLPDELAEWLRERAAMETIKRKKYMSINALVAEIFEREMEADQRKEVNGEKAATKA